MLLGKDGRIIAANKLLKPYFIDQKMYKKAFKVFVKGTPFFDKIVLGLVIVIVAVIGLAYGLGQNENAIMWGFLALGSSFIVVFIYWYCYALFKNFKIDKLKKEQYEIYLLHKDEYVDGIELFDLERKYYKVCKRIISICMEIGLIFAISNIVSGVIAKDVSGYIGGAIAILVMFLILAVIIMIFPMIKFVQKRKIYINRIMGKHFIGIESISDEEKLLEEEI